MAARRIIITDLPEALGRALAHHAARVGFDLASGPGMPGGVVLSAFAVEQAVPTDTPFSIAIGRGIDVATQTQSLNGGAADVIDLDWSPALIGARLAQLAEIAELRQKIGIELRSKERELEDARTLQRALVPAPAADAQVTIDVVLEPATELGGDLVDHLRIHDGRIMLALGDVSGKGAPAALTMARTHTLLRSLALRGYASELLSPPDIAARRLNGMLAIDNDGCMFVTMFLGLLDPETGKLAYVRCGQIPPFLRRRDGSVERLDAVGGVPLGVLEDAVYAVGHVTLASGDTLLVVSDGVTEAEAPDGTLLGEEPVLEWLVKPREELGTLVARTRDHEAGGAPSDDLSALLVRLR